MHHLGKTLHICKRWRGLTAGTLPHLALCALAAWLTVMGARGSNLHLVSSEQGLSSMSVFSLHQDARGFLWAGTYEGLNRLNGSHITRYGTGHNGRDELSGDLIEKVHEAQDGVLWIHNNYGFDRFDTNHGTMEYHPEISGTYKTCASGQAVLAMNGDNYCYYYNKVTRRFVRHALPGIRFSDVLAMDAKGGDVRMVTRKATLLYHIAPQPNGDIALQKAAELPNPPDIAFACADHDAQRLYLCDRQHRIYLREGTTGKATLLCQMRPTPHMQGPVVAIAQDGADLVVGFKQEGAMRLHDVLPAKGAQPPTSPRTPAQTDLLIPCGVYDICRDRRQDVLWIATDGKGIYSYTREPFDFMPLVSATSGFRIKKQARAICRDQGGQLWMGTKGDGIYRVSIPTLRGGEDGGERFSTANSALNHDMVFHIAPSRQWNILWIGTEGDGLCYYSYASGQFKVLRGGPQLRCIHEVVETAPGELWAASNWYGVFRLRVESRGGEPQRITACQQYLYNRREPGRSQFFTIRPQGDRYLWLASRENGVYRYDLSTHRFTHLLFSQNRRDPINDVHVLNTDIAGHIVCGTSAGLVDLIPRADGRTTLRNITQRVGMGRTAVRSLLHDGGTSLWACTAHGLLHYDVATGTSTYYDPSTGILLPEFCDGAAFYDAASDTRFFGGTDQVIMVAPSPQPQTSNLTHPPILFYGITDGRQELPLSRFLRGDSVLTLRHDQTHLVLNYDAIDYTREGNYVFEYLIEGLSRQWAVNTQGRTLALTGLQAGRYTIRMRYRDGAYLSPSYTLRVSVVPPWFLSWPAKVAYTLVALALAAVAIRWYRARQWYKRTLLMEQLEKEKKEAAYEAKLQFFTNVTHEFTLPLQLISGPCQRILRNPHADDHTRQYATLIRRNAARLNDLMQEILEFRKIERNERQMDITTVGVSQTIRDIAESFALLAEQRGIDYRVDTAQDTEWSLDQEAFITIVTNLTAHAFRFTPKGGRIAIAEQATAEGLRLTVANSGDADTQRQLMAHIGHSHLADLLEARAEEQGARGLARTSLELATCHGLARLMGGRLDLDTEGASVCFTLWLPASHDAGQAPKGEGAGTEDGERIGHNTGYLRHRPVTIDWTAEQEQGAAAPQAVPTIDDRRSTILVVDGDKEMRWLMNDMFADDYNVLMAANAHEARQLMQQTLPDIVVADAELQPVSGTQLCAAIKQEKPTQHIPVVLLSSQHDDAVREECLRAGADICLTKPYEEDNLHSIVAGLLKRNDVLKDYYKSAVSAFRLTEGRVLHEKERRLVEKVTTIIRDNIDNPLLSTKYVAAELGMTTRNLYRQLQGITSDTPSAIIKETRLERARSLLAKSELTVEEIIPRAGFSNRATFFHLFSTRFGCTPREYREQQRQQARDLLGRK